MIEIKPAKRPYDAHLPPTECYKETRDRVVQLAAANSVSLAEIIRQAVEFFLSAHLPEKQEEFQYRKDRDGNGRIAS